MLQFTVIVLKVSLSEFLVCAFESKFHSRSARTTFPHFHATKQSQESRPPTDFYLCIIMDFLYAFMSCGSQKIILQKKKLSPVEAQQVFGIFFIPNKSERNLKCFFIDEIIMCRYWQWPSPSLVWPHIEMYIFLLFKVDLWVWRVGWHERRVLLLISEWFLNILGWKFV